MMPCIPICKLCPKLVISTRVLLSGGNLLIDIPSGTYLNGHKYCIVINQPIPAAATINEPVNIIINGDLTNLYPLTRCDCTQVTAAALRTRTRYSTIVRTSATGGVFRLIGDDLPPTPDTSLPSLPVVVP